MSLLVKVPQLAKTRICCSFSKVQTNKRKSSIRGLNLITKMEGDELFEVTPEARSEWLDSILKALRFAVYEKSTVFGYDFEADKPLSRPNDRFSWEGKAKSVGRALQRSSLSTITSMDTDRESGIPDIPHEASRLSVWRSSAV